MRPGWRVILTLLALATALPAPASGPAVHGGEVQAILADATARLNHGDLQGALAAALQARALAPDYPQVHATLGLILQRQGDEQRALDEYTRFQLFGLLERGAPDESLTHEIAAAEALLVYLINEERLARGLPLLCPDLTLAEMARQHSEEMRDLGYFSHSSPRRRNCSLEARFRNAFHYRPQAAAENVSRMSGTLWSFTPENIRDSHDRLMASPGHCANILWDRVTHIGVGIAVNESGDYWITEDFALLEP